MDTRRLVRLRDARRGRWSGVRLICRAHLDPNAWETACVEADGCTVTLRPGETLPDHGPECRCVWHGVSARKSIADEQL